MPIKPDAQSLDVASARTRESAARLYNQKINDYAAELAKRLGPAYGQKEVDWPRLVELWETRNPDVDPDKAWADAIEQAEALIAADPSIDPAKVRAEIPVEVARRVFPKREEAIKSNGGTTYAEWADFADEIEKRAAKLRPLPPPQPEPEILNDPSAEKPVVPTEVVGPEPAVPVASETGTMTPEGALGPDGAPPSDLGVGDVTPLMQRDPGAL